MQNANEKMVPLDVTGDPVEVELKDENEKEEAVKIQENPNFMIMSTALKMQFLSHVFVMV